MFRIIFTPETVKRLKQELANAYARGDKRAVRRLSVLVVIGRWMVLEQILALWNVSQQSVYNLWVDELVDLEASCAQDVCLGALTHGFAIHTETPSPPHPRPFPRPDGYTSC